MSAGITRRQWMGGVGGVAGMVLLGHRGAAVEKSRGAEASSLPRFDYSKIKNPVWRLSEMHLRDPAALLHDGKVYLWFTYYDPRKKMWHIGQSATEDFVSFEDIRLVSPSGYASPGNVIRVGDEWILCYQQYAKFPHYLCIARSKDLLHWSDPEKIFNTGPGNRWNIDHRTIDPLIVPWKDTFYLFYVGSTRWGRKTPGHNLIGLATSKDLKHWKDVTPDEPLIAADQPYEQPDGNENNWVLRYQGRWFMLYSASLAQQKIAYAVSDDLLHWEKKGLCNVKAFPGTSRRFGAPIVLENIGKPGAYYMLYQGEDATGHMSFFLLESRNLVDWQ